MPQATSSPGADLGQLQSLLERSRADSTPAGVYLLWAVLIPFGFGLVDARSPLTGLYWLVAAPAGFVLSLWLGARASRRAGQVEHDEGRRHMLHWAGMMGATALLVPLAQSGDLSQGAFPRLVLLLLALCYFLDGVHEDRSMLWLGLIIAAG